MIYMLFKSCLLLICRTRWMASRLPPQKGREEPDPKSLIVKKEIIESYYCKRSEHIIGGRTKKSIMLRGVSMYAVYFERLVSQMPIILSWVDLHIPARPQSLNKCRALEHSTQMVFT